MKSRNYIGSLRKCVVLCALTALAVQSSFAEIIPASRRITWQAGVVGGIPDRPTVFTTLPAASTLAQINSAIASCPAGQVVQFAAGTYALTGAILVKRNGVVLRGAGPGLTNLRFDSGSDYGNVKFAGTPFNDPNVNQPPNLRDWTAGYAQGSTTITLSSTAGLSVGAMIILDQLNDNIDVNGSGTEGCGYCGRQSGGRVQMQSVTVTGINGNDVSITPGLYMPNWSAARSPQVWWIGGPVEMCGLEDLDVTNVGGSDHSITFVNARNCWVKNVRSFNAGGEHVRSYLAANIDVRHCYFYGTKNAASQSYGVNWYWAWDCMCLDNIFNKVTSPVSLEAGSEGHVVAYNYFTNMYYTVDPSWMIEAMMTHGAHSSFNLFEGNYGSILYLDFIHGSGSHNTVLRNRFLGWEPNKTGNTFAVAVQKFNHYQNFLGNILGKAGYHNTYECASAPCSSGSAVWYLGYDTTQGQFPTGYDSAVVGTLLRHGNYDVVTAGIRWDPTIADHNIPTSLFLSTKPDWFGDRPWPAFDAANANGASVTNLPAGYRFVFGTDPPSGGPVNNAPVSIANASPRVGALPLTVNFSSAGSLDPEGAPLTYAWTFGDGKTSTAANPVNTYTTNGTFNVRLTVSDGTNTSSTNLTILVTIPGQNLPPTASATGSPASGFAPLTVTFSSTASDPEGAALSYSWTFGDGSTSVQANPTHIYNTPGAYVAQLRVSDGTNTVSASPINVSVTDRGTGLVAAYGFEEGTGSTLGDSSGNNNAGVISGGTWSNQGKYGYALSFNGLSDLVVINPSSTLNVSSQMTLEAWVYPTLAQASWSTILHRETDAYYLHASSPAGSMVPAGGAIYNGSESYVSGASAIPINAWSHLAVTYDGAVMALYVNGTQVATKPATGSIQNNSNPLRIGGNVPYGQYFQGLIDEVRVYNRALSVSEVQSDMNKPVVGTSSKPLPPSNLRVVAQ